jgi:hypothetical protein
MAGIRGMIPCIRKPCYVRLNNEEPWEETPESFGHVGSQVHLSIIYVGIAEVLVYRTSVPRNSTYSSWAK